MNNMRSSRDALIVGIALALLAGCGGSQPPIGAQGVMPLQPSATSVRAARRMLFDYAGGMQTFKVPLHVTNVTVTASGASGGLAGGSGPSAAGGLIKATISVVPGESLTIVVGGAGTPYGPGYNGGGYGGISRSCSGSCSGACVVSNSGTLGRSAHKRALDGSNDFERLGR
jgi:hypothetical protein